jgi:HEAT repeat protein
MMGLFGPPDVAKLQAKRDARGLIKALAYPKDAAVRRAAAVALGGMKAAEALEALIDALHDSAADVRGNAACALGLIGDLRAVEPLVAVLKTGEGHMRWMAAASLGQIGDARAVEPLVAALKDKDADRAAAAALGQIGNARAVEQLVATLKADKWYVRKAAAEALDRSGWRPDRGQVGAAYWLAKQKWDDCVAIGTPAVELLIAALNDEEVLVRKGAAQALGGIGDRQAVEPLIALLQDKDPDMRTRAAAALGFIGDARAAVPLIPLLKERLLESGRAAGMALQRIGAPAVEPLIVALTGADESVRQDAADVLGWIGDGRAVEPLIAALTDETPGVRMAAAQALDNLGWKPGNDRAGAAYWAAHCRWEKCVAIGSAAAEPLIVALRDPHAAARRAVARALDGVGWKPDRGPAGAAYRLAQGRWDECVALGAPALEPLIFALSDEEWQVRRSAATALLSLCAAGTLAAADKQRILAQRTAITAGHVDGSQHTDSGASSDCHTDEAHHEDHGIGLDFPM